MTLFFTVLVILLAVAAVYIAILLRPSGRTVPEVLKCNYAHRGLHGGDVDENSLTAFERAAERGVGIELDVQLTKDGEVVVFHDYELERMTGERKRLSELTLSELRELCFIRSGEKIPTLSEVLETVRSRVPLLVELKGENLNKGLCPRVDKIMSDYDGEYCIESFNPVLLSWYKKHRPDVIRGILTTSLCRAKGLRPLHFLLDAMVLNCIARPDFIAYDFTSADRLPIKLCTGIFGAAKFTWTLKTPADLADAKNTGACGIFEGFEV